MAYRLVFQLGDGTQRNPLTPGENLVGSSDECGVQLRHPTVSRRHAAIRVSDGGLVLEDLGSTNGTRLDGKKVVSPTVIEAGAAITVGSVEGVLELISEADLEVGVSLRDDVERRSGAIPSPAVAAVVTTIAPTVLEAFAFEHLPALVDRLEQGVGAGELARNVGQALFDALPCRRVEIVRRVGSDHGLLFTARRDSERSTDPAPVEIDSGDLRMRVDFAQPSFVQAYGPLIRIAASLLRLGSEPAETGNARHEKRTPPPLPEPPTVVTEMRELYQQASRVARGTVSVLIRGDSGTGKELLARYIYAASERAEKPLMTLNCAALPRDLLEAELFGVERGVATGVDERPGKFEAADGGTLFLDEIGDMSPATQAKILRVLQEGEVYRLGGHQPHPANVRVISATNRDIEAMREEGKFRSDLYYRIADWVVEIPPLCSRRADIPNLAAHFLGQACAERGVRPAGISRAAVQALTVYDWPGNVRQLEKEMARAALFLEDDELLDTGRLQPAILEGSQEPPPGGLKQVLEEVERREIQRALEASGGDVAATAQRLELGRSTLYRRMKVLGIVD